MDPRGGLKLEDVVMDGGYFRKKNTLCKFISSFLEKYSEDKVFFVDIYMTCLCVYVDIIDIIYIYIYV